MHATAFETTGIKQLAKVRGGVLLVDIGRAAIAPELDTLVTQLAKRFQRFRRIAGEFTPNRVELESNRNGLRGVGRLEESRAEAHPEGTTEGRFDEPTAWGLHR